MKREKTVDGIILRHGSEGVSKVKNNQKTVHLDDMTLSKNTRPTPAAKPRKKPIIEVSVEKPIKKTVREDNSLRLDRDLAKTLSELDVDHISDEIDTPSNPMLDENLSARTERKKRKQEKKLKNRKRRRIVRVCVILIVLAIVGTAAWFGSSALNSFCKVFGCDASNILDIIRGAATPSTPLDTDKNGRTNILVFGTSDDDEGHEGAELTDSIMIISLDQKKNNAFTFSVPRDLWVTYGRACSTGYQGKINIFYSCVGGAQGDPTKDREALKESIGFFSDILGVDIQYAANVNYTVLRDAVKAVGGKITVTIDSTDERGILDSSFDNFCGKTMEEKQRKCPRGHFLQLTNGEHEIDADMALSLSLARGHEGAMSYGLSRSNFDRELNQQAVLRGILNQAKKTGVLSNISQILPLIDSLGNNLRTTFDVKDISKIKTLIELAPKINVDEIESLDLCSEGLFVNDMINGQSAVIPSAGQFNYSEIHTFLQASLTSNPIQKEKATISVYNASGITGEASRIAKLLSDQNLKATAIGNAESANAKYVIYDLTNGNKPETAKLISQTLNDTTIKKATRTDLPNDIITDADFVVIIGKQ